ncbi:MAG: hypothetical protein H6509_11600 [Bryobacterales bacterium]|nr:hypothetical protein [Bryobacterales bacterium]
MIPEFDRETGALPPGEHRATLREIEERLGFTPRRRWLLGGLRTAVNAFRAAGIAEIFIDGSFCTTKPDPADIDGYWVEPDEDVYERIDPYWIDFERIFIPHLRKQKWRMWADYGVEFFIHPIMSAREDESFPAFFRHDRDGKPRGLIRILESSDD